MKLLQFGAPLSTRNFKTTKYYLLTIAAHFCYDVNGSRARFITSVMEMNPTNQLDIKGCLADYPFAELLVELLQTGLGGSLRLSRESEKVVIYFSEGRIAFGVSNSRSHRLFNFLISGNYVEQSVLANYPTIANDLELTAQLVRDSHLSKESAVNVAVTQIETILVDTLGWPDGEWLFSPHARLRSDLDFPIDAHKILINCARCVPLQTISERFRSVNEAFSVVPERTNYVNLLAHEAYLLGQFGDDPLMIGELRERCTLPEQGVLQSLYVLWMGGVLFRRDWNAAISAVKLGQIKAAKLSLVKTAIQPAVNGSSKAEIKTETEVPVIDEPEVVAITVSLEEYLERTEKAGNLYETLGIAPDAALDAIKFNYFGLAKLFHPDRYHREQADTLRRIHTAFTNIAQAYETLKVAESRETYDYKMRKEAEALEKRRASGLSETLDTGERMEASGLESFEQGMEMLEDGEYAAAAALFARAVHYSPENSIFRAHFGKALSADKKQRHKAETELQAAVRLDPKNPKIRFMLIDFFTEINMLKRAEGELARFLEIDPSNEEAAAKLQNLRF